VKVSNLYNKDGRKFQSVRDQRIEANRAEAYRLDWIEANRLVSKVAKDVYELEEREQEKD